MINSRIVDYYKVYSILPDICQSPKWCPNPLIFQRKFQLSLRGAVGDVAISVMEVRLLRFARSDTDEVGFLNLDSMVDGGQPKSAIKMSSYLRKTPLRKGRLRYKRMRRIPIEISKFSGFSLFMMLLNLKEGSPRYSGAP